jgi:hypothetical protein
LTKQLLLQNKLPLLVFLCTLVRAIVLPAHNFFALPAVDVTYYVASRCHVAFVRVGGEGVDDGVEEVGFAVLAAEILGEC